MERWSRSDGELRRIDCTEPFRPNELCSVSSYVEETMKDPRGISEGSTLHRRREPAKLQDLCEIWLDRATSDD